MLQGTLSCLKFYICMVSLRMQMLVTFSFLIKNRLEEEFLVIKGQSVTIFVYLFT